MKDITEEKIKHSCSLNFHPKKDNPQKKRKKRRRSKQHIKTKTNTLTAREKKTNGKKYISFEP